MASFWKFVKNHKGVIIFLIALIAIGISMFLFARSILLSGKEGTIYGNRLEGIDKVKLNEDTLNKIVSDIKANEKVANATKRLEGKLLNFTIDVKKDTDIETAKKLSDVILPALTENEKSFYDIQVIITCNELEESEEYPIMGYKHRTSAAFVW